MYSLIFIPAPPSRGKERFLSFFIFDRKCHGIRPCMIGTSYLRDYFYCNDGIMSNRLNLNAGDSRLSPAFFVCLQDTYHPKCVVSCQSGGFCFSLSAHGTPLFTRCVISCPLAPAPFLCSYLATCLLQQNHQLYK